MRVLVLTNEISTHPSIAVVKIFLLASAGTVFPTPGPSAVTTAPTGVPETCMTISVDIEGAEKFDGTYVMVSGTTEGTSHHGTFTVKNKNALFPPFFVFVLQLCIVRSRLLLLAVETEKSMKTSLRPGAVHDGGVDGRHDYCCGIALSRVHTPCPLPLLLARVVRYCGE